MSKTPVFSVGQKVIATGSYNWKLTEGKEYTVVGYQAEDVTPTFTWPACVTVMGDCGAKVTSHTYRFRPSVSSEVAA